MLRFLTGRNLMLTVLSRVEALIHHLERAVSHIREDIDNNEVAIDRLMSENKSLIEHAERAARVSAKFRDLLA
jgi:hypothetical protein